MIQTIQTNYLYIIALGITLFLCLLNISIEPLHEWDESRNGMNAIEMLNNGDYINLYYAREPDHWNAKPPLLIWLIVLVYKLFGTNEFALRLPSAIASIITIHFLFNLVTLFKSKLFAFFSCICLISVSGFMGYHIGKTGDFDALLLAFLMGGIFHFIKYITQQKSLDIYLTAIFFSLAFLTKGLAFLLVVPSLAILGIFEFNKSNFNKHFGLAVLILVFTLISWFSISAIAGEEFKNQEHGRNFLEVMLKNDIINRFTGVGFSENTQKTWDQYFYLFIYLDTRFSFWYIAFYLTIFMGIYRYHTQKLSVKANIAKIRKDKLLFLSILIIFPVSIILGLIQNIHFWYMTPVIPFLAIVSTYVIITVWEKSNPVLKFIVILFCIINLMVRIVNIKNFDTIPEIIEQTKPHLKNAEKIIIYGGIPSQDILLYINFQNENIEYQSQNEITGLKSNEILFSRKTDFPYDKKIFQIIGEDKVYLVLKRN